MHSSTQRRALAVNNNKNPAYDAKSAVEYSKLGDEAVYTVDFMISRSRMLEAIANQPSPTKVNRDEHAQTKQTLDINATTDISLDIESKSKVHIGDGRHQLNSQCP